MRIMLLAAVMFLMLAVLAVGKVEPLEGEAWSLDVVHLSNGTTLCGLVLEQTAQAVRLKSVSRRRGAPTVVITLEIPGSEVKQVELLDEPSRRRLRHRLDAIQQQRQVLIEQLRSLQAGAPPTAEVLPLRRARWISDTPVPALQYDSTHFQLLSNARREVVELAAICLEQIYAAYTRILPPRADGKPTQIVLAGSLKEYQRLLGGRGLDLANPAFFDPQRNQIFCASELERLADEWYQARQHHVRLRAELAQREGELRAAYQGAIPAGLRASIDGIRKEIAATEAHNATAFHRASERLVQRLYHEAFHAYLAGFVYPAPEATLPRWLNEGLAQIFETALLEAGEVRLGHADGQRLEMVRRQLAQGSFVPLAQLLRSGAEQFQVAHGRDGQTSDRYYLASWALAFYLTFERRVLGSPLDDYVAALHRGADPVQALQKLSGQALPVLERDFHDYLRHLRPDGSVAGR